MTKKQKNPHAIPHIPEIHRVNKQDEADAWAEFPIWTENVTRVQLNYGMQKGITGTVVERQEPLSVGFMFTPGRYKVRWDDPQYGTSGWLLPGEALILVGEP